ncbi:hypothetical protein [Flavobacterium sp. N2820]|uniref:hypothetical protein n=1 Tax=Flavobacterium sp. N2820 TaxID=2986834 RepID=UPI0022244BCF|nr:hypothetical protein [Flavobacterium sp. N2820]
MKLIKALLIDNDLETIQQIKRFSDENAVIIFFSGYSNSLQESIPLLQEMRPELVFFKSNRGQYGSF